MTISRLHHPLARLRVAALVLLGLLMTVPLACRSRLPAARDAGMSTAEYAVGTVAAVAFAGARRTTSFDVPI